MQSVWATNVLGAMLVAREHLVERRTPRIRRRHRIRREQIHPSEVQTEFFRGRKFSERKLRALDIAQAIISMLEFDDRGFVTEMSVWATNPD